MTAYHDGVGPSTKGGGGACLAPPSKSAVETFVAIRVKREAKGKDKNRYQELKAEVQRKLRVDKQHLMEGMCVDLEASDRVRSLTCRNRECYSQL